MIKKTFSSGIMLLLFIAGMLASRPLHAFSIDGPTVACLGSVQTYSASPTTAGSYYYWSVTPGGTVLTGNPANPTSIQFVAVGTRTVTAVEQDASGTILSTETLVVTVYPIPAPYFTADKRAACQTFDSTADTSNPEYKRPPDYFVDDEGGCVKVCEGSYVEYRAHTTSLSAGSFLWAVTGGTIVSGTTTSSVIVVKWGSPGAGNITLTETNAGGCIGTKSVCFDIIPKPAASFRIVPNAGPVASYTVCAGATLAFEDLSTAPGSSIVYWRYDFGDGSVSPLPDPAHSYSAAGTYTVTLAVKNSCGCIDSFQTEIEVLSDPGPDIECPAVVCAGETATYSTTVSGCLTYNWTVTGGTITSGAGTGAIEVTWGTGGTTGYGYVSLSVSGCPGSVCPGTTTVKVPIVQTNPTVTGPANPICTNKPVQYSIPLWGGTRYQWGVIGNPACVVSGRDNNEVTLQFPAAGTYTVHVWWQNTLKFCGGDKKFTVVVEDPPAIVGADPAYCIGATFSASLTPTAIGDWTISGPAGTFTFPATSSISGIVPAVPGLYTISVDGTTFCPPDPIVVKVLATLPPPDNIDGESKVCFGHPYTYKATAAMPGAIFEWSVTPSSSATLSAPTGNEVVAVWSAPGTISVRRVTTEWPHCGGNSISINVIELPVNVNITGEAEPCANASYNYSHNYLEEEGTTWSINNHTTGSVTSGIYSVNNTILWNNVPGITVATITATVLKCGVEHTDTKIVTVNPAPTVEITTTLGGPVCSSDPVVFTATCGASSYSWDFGDGSDPVVTTSGVYTVAHTFTPSFTTTATATYTVCVTATGSAVCACPAVGTGCTTVDVIPGPKVTISPASTPLICDGDPISVYMTSTTINAVPAVTYQWYLDGSPISGATDPTYTATALGTYKLKITDATGCSYLSSFIKVRYVDCTPDGGCSRAILLGCTAGPCGTITCTVTPTGGGTLTSVGWIATDGYTSFVPGGSGGTFTLDLEYPTTGTYHIHAFGEYDDGCTGEYNETKDIPVIAHMNWSWDCSTSPYTLYLHGTPDVLTGYSVSHAWTVSGTGGGTSSSSDPVFTSLSAGSHTITYTASTSPPGTCTITENVLVPDVTAIDFTASPSLPYNLCEGLPVTFTPVVTAGTISSYHWDFDDGATLIANPGTRNFKWPALSSVPHPFDVVLSGINSIGCPYTVNHSVLVYPNTLNGTISNPNPVACMPPVVLTASPSPGYAPYTYSWAPTPPVSTSINDFVSVTGSYYVTIVDSKQCQYVVHPTADATILNSTPPVIEGDNNYCYGDVIKLGGYVGTGYTYQWYRDAVALPGATAYTLAQAGVLPGTYTYRLRITTPSYMGVVCTLYSANYPVTMHALPPDPVLSGPVVVNCSTYELELTASSGVLSPTYVWSGGDPGYGVTNTVNSGGAYRCWLTDLNGCTSHADIVVPAGPETFRDWFPAGCYAWCSNILGDGGIRLFGPPGSFDVWDWILNSSSYSSGGPGPISPITITSTGDYGLYINNGLCDATFDTMTVSEQQCQCATVIDSVHVECDTAYGSPHGYKVSLWLTNPYGAVTATVGSVDGPFVPTTFTMTPGGSTLYTFDFTILTIPPPVFTTIWIHYVIDGRDCWDKVVVQPLPNCTWTAEKQGPQATAAVQDSRNTGMLLHPNPAQAEVNVTYTYPPGNAQRSMRVYDALGRQVAAVPVGTASGTVTIPLGNAAPGIYLVKMEEDGRALHVQRLVISH